MRFLKTFTDLNIQEVNANIDGIMDSVIHCDANNSGQRWRHRADRERFRFRSLKLEGLGLLLSGLSLTAVDSSLEATQIQINPFSSG